MSGLYAEFPPRQDCELLMPNSMFLCEQTLVDQPLLSKMPDITLTSSAQDGFHQAAQAAWLLDRVLDTLSTPESEDRHMRLRGLDFTLQRFLTIMTEPSSGASTVFCWAISIAIR
jgi:hypothetical protein